MSRPDYAEDLIRISLHKDTSDESGGVLSQVANTLISKVWYIHESTENKFITSDNPGYCLDSNNDIFNLNFHKGFTFIFPLSPTQTLFIHDSEDDKEILNRPIKKIIFKNSTEEEVQTTNRWTTAISTEFIYSNSEQTLISTINDWKEQFGNDPRFPME